MKISAIIPSAGKGIRFSNKIKKQYVLIKNKPLIIHTIERVLACKKIDELYLIVPPEDEDEVNKKILAPFDLKRKVKVFPGGKTRQESVYFGLLAIKSSDFVLIHDGVRPLVTPELVSLALEKAMLTGGSTPIISLKETLIELDNKINFPNRERFRLVQTPQAFAYDLLLMAHKRAREDGINATDDASLVVNFGGKISLFPGSYINIKVTTYEDLLIVNQLIDLGNKYENRYRF
ncbi:MAG: 2-C-methyl-D-erythritol 4-phosphate cytidylyltransferase [Deltaproteobacteria bacterium]|nr:MAG: 2-C-methyl-D-erythritol 4-phosphate cytidylyltransferase [Deltaproteobacteria bacterium]